MHLFAKKSLGQHFLKSQGALRTIVEAARLTAEDLVLEIGPGKGILTAKLLEKGCRVIAVEKDDRMIAHLSETFASAMASGKLSLIHADILKLDLSDLGLNGGNYVLAANLPYYITGAALRLFLSSPVQPARAVLLLQKEVAKRISASDGKESLLSISVKIYGDPRYLETVKAKYFSPPPSVDSAIILIDNINRSKLEGVDEYAFFELIKKSFAHKRKQLVGNLIGTYELEKLERVFLEIGIERQARAENITVGQWIELVKKLNS